MILDLMTLGAFVLIFAIGLRMLFRALRRDRSASEVRCGGCGVEAMQVEDFICRVCGRDVRHCGLVLAEDRKGTTVLGLCTGFTCLLVILATVATGIAMAALQGERFRVNDENYTVSGTDIDLIFFDLRGTRTSSRAIAHLVLKSGKAAVIEIAVPELKCDLAAGDGTIVGRNLSFDVESIRRWFAIAGLNLNDPQIEQAASHLYFQMMRDFGIPPEIAPPQAGSARILSSRGGSGSMSAGDSPRWLERTALIVWPSIWLIGIRFLAVPPARRRAVVVDEIALVK